LALAANRFQIPFFVAEPLSRFDFNISIYDTKIEERDPEEVTHYVVAGFVQRN